MTRATVVFLGPAEVGKSTLIGLLGERAINVHHRGRTVGMDHAVLRDGPCEATLLGVPGQDRFASVRDVLLGMSAAAVWVQPAGAAPDAVTSRLLAGTRGKLPYLIFVNQRAGDGDAPSVEPHSALAYPPREILAGDPVADPKVREQLRSAIWKLVED